MIDGLNKALEIMRLQMDSNLHACRGKMYAHVVNDHILELYKKIEIELKMIHMENGKCRVNKMTTTEFKPGNKNEF